MEETINGTKEEKNIYKYSEFPKDRCPTSGTEDISGGLCDYISEAELCPCTGTGCCSPVRKEWGGKGGKSSIYIRGDRTGRDRNIGEGRNSKRNVGSGI